MRGCDKFCTFCVVPYVRGRERSLPADAILAEVRALAAPATREIVFLGQTVNAYRDGDCDFASCCAAPPTSTASRASASRRRTPPT